MMKAERTTRFTYLEGGAPATFAAFHPAAGARRRRAVLLCPPFGWEDMCSYRSRRDWAERLASAGFPALRFDLPGSGDSADGPPGEGRLDGWTRATADAARWLAEQSAGALVVALGIGLGGLLAARAALADAPIDELVLWQVPARARSLLRELRAFERLEVAYIPDEAAERQMSAPEPLEEGALVANGYLLNAATVAELERLDLAELLDGAAPERQPRRALLLERDGLKVDERLRSALERAGTDVTVANGAGFGAMMVEPQEATSPLRTFEMLDEWLEQGEQAPAQAPRAADEPNAGARGVKASEQLLLTHEGVRLREQPVSAEGPEGRLFGILTEPLGARRDLCAMLVNAGAQRRTGPNRMWVEIARRWAARGVPTLRFDLAGIGDSDGDDASLVQVATIYKPSYGEETRVALEAMAARGLPQRFVVLGLCAGGYWALHTALADERVRSVVMLNPRSLIWDEGVYGARRARELRERLFLASTWRRALRGELTLARHMETARALALRAWRAPRRLRARLSGSQDRPLDRTAALAGVLDELRDRRQSALLLFTGSEPLHDELAGRGLLAERERWPNLEIAIRGTSADTHTLTPLWLQRQVHELVDGALERELELASAANGRVDDGEDRGALARAAGGADAPDPADAG